MSNVKTPTIHIYTEINVGEFETVQHYNLFNVLNGWQIVPERIKIEKNRFFAKSNPKFWLKIKVGKKFVNLTGLFFNAKHNIYFGDKGKNNTPEDLIIVKIDNDNERLTLYYFKGYYTRNLDNIIQFIIQ
jgi:hypothetical protein